MGVQKVQHLYDIFSLVQFFANNSYLQNERLSVGLYIQSKIILTM